MFLLIARHPDRNECVLKCALLPSAGRLCNLASKYLRWTFHLKLLLIVAKTWVYPIRSASTQAVCFNSQHVKSACSPWGHSSRKPITVRALHDWRVPKLLQLTQTERMMSTPDSLCVWRASQTILIGLAQTPAIPSLPLPLPASGCSISETEMARFSNSQSTLGTWWRGRLLAIHDWSINIHIGL